MDIDASVGLVSMSRAPHVKKKGGRRLAYELHEGNRRMLTRYVNRCFKPDVEGFEFEVRRGTGVTLPAALDSVLSQENVELEFIAVDDGSNDGSGKILEEAAARDPRLKVIHKKNEGLTRALIEGCAMASAPWIARQDDHPVLVGCAVQVTVPESVVEEDIHPPTGLAAARRQLLEEGRAMSPYGSIVFSREAYRLVGGYRAVFYYAQDIDLTTRLAEVGPVSAVDECFYEYVFSPSALSGCFGCYLKKAVFCRPWSGKTWVRLTQAWWLSERREHETSGV